MWTKMSQTKSSAKRTIHLQELTLKLRAKLSPENRTRILKIGSHPLPTHGGVFWLVFGQLFG